jgi:hypothetical protein
MKSIVIRKDHLLAIGMTVILALLVVSCADDSTAPVITGTNSTTFTEGEAGTFTIMATGFPYPSFSITGALPSGVTLNSKTGVLSGTPAVGAKGTYPLTITARNRKSSVTQNFTLIVRQAFGVVALSTVGSIGILDSNTQTLTSINLTGQLGTYGGGLFDVAITPDGNTTLISNFGDAKVYFINTSDPSAPVVSGSLTLAYLNNEDPPAEANMFAEDITITPDGRFALVTDGGFSTTIAVINIANRSLVEMSGIGDTKSHNAVSISPDGQTVLTADFFNGFVHAYTINAAGHLTFVASTDVSNRDNANAMTTRPVNLAISPDGRTVIVGPYGIASTITFPVLTITGPGHLSAPTYITPTTSIEGFQSIVFNPTGTRAYVHCSTPAPDPLPDPDYEEKNVIMTLNITAPGVVSQTGTPLAIDFFNKSMLFGVDTLALDRTGEHLYVSNPTISGGLTYIQVINISTNTIAKRINIAPVDTGDPEPTESIPTGITFWHP